MGAKCTHPSDSFLICGLRIMCLMLHNNIFFSQTSSYLNHTCSQFIFVSFDFTIFIFISVLFFPSLSHLCLIIFRHQIESKFVFWIQHKNAGSLNYCSKEAHDLPLHDSSAQVWLSTQKFLLNCLICSSSARVHTQHGYAFKVWWSILFDLHDRILPCWCRRKSTRSSVREWCCVSPNLTSWCPNLSISLLDLLPSVSYRKQKSEVHLSFTSLFFFLIPFWMFFCMFCNCHIFFFSAFQA